LKQIESIEINTDTNPIGSIIWLHGLGADGHDFEQIVPELNLPKDIPLRFVFPHAPIQPVTVNNGMAMRSWYDILSFDREGRADRESFLKSCDFLCCLIDKEIKRGIKEDKIVIAGFSQGGAVAIHTALQSSYNIAGLMALSTYVALSDISDTAICRKNLPIFMAHGTFDPVLEIDWGRESANKIIESGYSVDWHEYSMGHTISSKEITDISKWLSHIYL
tara:strand:+ start:5429 stop:6088 length:660 start_codon:yes stop_codon:yes gene_type:complete